MTDNHSPVTKAVSYIAVFAMGLTAAKVFGRPAEPKIVQRTVVRYLHATPQPFTFTRFKAPCNGARIVKQSTSFVWTCQNGDGFEARIVQ